MDRYPERVLCLRLSGPRPPDPRRAAVDARGISSRSASIPWPTSALMSRPSARESPARSTARCLPAFIARRPFPCSDRRVHQHGADRCLPRRRPAGGLLRAGTPRRRGGTRARDRSRRDPAAQSRAGSAMPYKTPIGPTYDCGNFPKVFRELLDIADYRLRASTGTRPRGAAARLRHRLLCRILRRRAVADAPALGARVGFFEAAMIRVQPDGSVQALLGTHNHGQGHATTLRADPPVRLGVPMARSRSSRATPTWCRMARARSARAPSRSAARRSTARRWTGPTSGG